MDVNRADRPSQESHQGEIEDVVGDDAGEQANREGNDDAEAGIHQRRHQQGDGRHRHDVLRVGIDRHDELGDQEQDQHQPA